MKEKPADGRRCAAAPGRPRHQPVMSIIEFRNSIISKIHGKKHNTIPRLTLKPCDAWVYAERLLEMHGAILRDRLRAMGSVHLVAQSMGGMIGQILLTKYPERLRSGTFIMTCPGPGNGKSSSPSPHNPHLILIVLT